MMPRMCQSMSAPWAFVRAFWGGPRKKAGERRACRRQTESVSLQRVLAPQLEQPELHHRDGTVPRHHAPRHVGAAPNGREEGAAFSKPRQRAQPPPWRRAGANAGGGEDHEQRRRNPMHANGVGGCAATARRLAPFPTARSPSTPARRCLRWQPSLRVLAAAQA